MEACDNAIQQNKTGSLCCIGFRLYNLTQNMLLNLGSIIYIKEDLKMSKEVLRKFLFQSAFYIMIGFIATRAVVAIAPDKAKNAIFSFAVGVLYSMYLAYRSASKNEK